MVIDLVAALQAAIETMSVDRYWPGVAAFLRVEERDGRVVVVSLPGYEGMTYPERIQVTVGPLTGKWVRCPVCGLYASGRERGMHYSIAGSFPLGCHDCRPPSEWISVMVPGEYMGLVRKTSIVGNDG